MAGRVSRTAGFGDPQAGGVTGGEDHAVLAGRDNAEKLDDFRRAQHDRQGLGLFGAGMISSKRQSFLSVTL